MGLRLISEYVSLSITCLPSTVATRIFEAKSKRGETLVLNSGIAIFTLSSLVFPLN
jgi:hypothetical protein